MHGFGQIKKTYQIIIFIYSLDIKDLSGLSNPYNLLSCNNILTAQ